MPLEYILLFYAMMARKLSLLGHRRQAALSVAAWSLSICDISPLAGGLWHGARPECYVRRRCHDNSIIADSEVPGPGDGSPAAPRADSVNLGPARDLR